MLLFTPLLLTLLEPAQTGHGRSDGVPIGNGITTPEVVLTAPHGGWTVDRMLLVEGSVTDPTVNPVVLSINGDRYLLRTQAGRFSRKFPAAAGKNVVVAMATNRGGTARDERTVYAQIPAVPLRAILTSDTDGVYTDLHVYEPSDAELEGGAFQPGAHVFWANTQSPSGGTFYLSEQGGNFDYPGFGPYLYVHRAPPPGLFVFTTNYWPSGDRAHTRATLNLTLYEGTAHELRRNVSVPLATAGTTRVLAWVNVLPKGAGALIYVPRQDQVPTGPMWPADLQQQTERFEKQGAE